MMTPEAQRIAIAEACGWKWEARIKGSIKVWNKPPLMVFYDSELPNYLNDLNAMHEAEKILIRPNLYAKGGWGRGMYLSYLSKVTDEQHPIDATAAQRAEAFLRTIDKWEGK